MERKLVKTCHNPGSNVVHDPAHFLKKPPFNRSVFLIKLIYIWKIIKKKNG